jgi:hypothetical protein
VGILRSYLVLALVFWSSHVGAAEVGSLHLREDGAIECRFQMTQESVSEQTHVALQIINPHANSGLTILFNATSGVENNAPVKAAFLRAARKWESLIYTPITVVINIDFGSNFFGSPYSDARILGATDAAAGVVSYSTAVQRLRTFAAYVFELDLYNRLTSRDLATDSGNVSMLVVPQANLRALAILPSTPSVFDTNPRIGFNSAHPWDFDRSDGVSGYDFEAVAAHEIAHVLGFASTVGTRELNPTAPPMATVLDIFRLRPGSSLDTFGTAVRIQSSGGEQEFAAVPYLRPLSTGRPDGSGGDNQQASHWKDDAFYHRNIGLMDPTLAPFRYQTITLWDAIALEVIGYSLRFPDRPTAAPSNLTASATSPTQARLSWTDNSSNEDDFRILIHDGTVWKEIIAIGPNRRDVTISSLLPSTSYSFAVGASNAGGFSDYSNVASVRTPSGCVAPAITTQPASITVASGSQATLSVVATGAQPISYQWYIGASGEGSAIAGAVSASYSTMANTATSQFWVKVTNTCGTVNSQTATITATAPTLPSPPVNLTYTDRLPDKVTLRWTHTGSNLTGFKTYYSLDGTRYFLIGPIPSDWRGVLISPLQATVSYHFRITAVNAAGESVPATILVPAFGSSKRRATRH